jgi:hypothetical protein
VQQTAISARGPSSRRRKAKMRGESVNVDDWHDGSGADERHLSAPVPKPAMPP